MGKILSLEPGTRCLLDPKGHSIRPQETTLPSPQAGAGAAASALNSYPSGTYCCATCNLGCSVHIITPIPQSLLKHLWCASFAGLLKIIHQISLLCPRLITNNWCYCTSRYLCFLVTERKKCDFQLLRELSYWLLSNARAITCYFFKNFLFCNGM